MNIEAHRNLRSTYYNNFASHLLNAFNPNMLYPDLPHRWTDEQWYRCIDMVASFGFSAFEFWLEPRLFCRDGLAERYGKVFTDQILRVTDYAHDCGLEVLMLCSLATVGSRWRTLCPAEEWEELVYLWREWLARLGTIDVVALFPGDPGACSLNGCTAETYIDRALEIAAIADAQPKPLEVELNTWGPPFFGWGIIEGPDGWTGDFHPEYQHTAWRFDGDRANRAMEHLVSKLEEFPARTSVAINLGFNPDGNPGGEDDARRWAREIASRRAVYSWDFSLTEGENAVTPHWRFERLFSRRREERDVGAYSGGICFTMTPLLNQLSLFESARSFSEPDADPNRIATEFFTALFGSDGASIPDLYRWFEIVDDWGYYSGNRPPRERIHDRMARLSEILESVNATDPAGFRFFPEPETYRCELLFYAELYRDLSAASPDYGALERRFWNRVYSIYDALPEHVDPRPVGATKRFIARFADEVNDAGGAP